MEAALDLSARIPGTDDDDDDDDDDDVVVIETGLLALEDPAVEAPLMVNALMTLPSALRDLLMCLASCKRAPSAAVLRT